MAGATNRGALLENAVYLELRRRLGWLAEGRVSYYRTERGREVDFAVDPITGDDSLRLIQVCSDLGAAGTVQREAQGLAEAMAECRIGRSTLVTLAESGEIQMESGTVEMVPFWEWALRAEI
jgi:predicted AAA+ superfamily ATPase